MRATFSHNGKKYIYKVDGKQVRTSQKAHPYECVAVRLYDGEFLGAIACGQYKTCAQYLNMDADIVSRYKITWGDYYIEVEDAAGFIDWLNRNHYDYRGLIPKKLALDATGLDIYANFNNI